jgi:ATP-dependent exoDNAse (exonuclease V) beta subunit
LLDITDGDFHPTAWQLAARLETDRDDAEDSRLLYVAATRAKEKLLISGHVKRKKDGSLDLNGWLARLGTVAGLNEIQISEEMSQPESFPSKMSGISLCVHPISAALDSDPPQPGSIPSNSHPPIGVDRSEVKGMLESITPAIPASDEKARARESDPPQRVWRIVSRTKHPSPPAWVVGRLVHESLRRWRFPAERQPGSLDMDFENFLRPFAFEAGLTDPEEIHTACQESRRLVERFHSHPVFAEMDAAERHHEVPYFLLDGRGVIDLLYRTQSGWFLVDFKTDQVHSETEALVAIRENGYDQQVARYALAVADQLKVEVKTRLVFLNVNDRLAIFNS